MQALAAPLLPRHEEGSREWKCRGFEPRGGMGPNVQHAHSENFQPIRFSSSAASGSDETWVTAAARAAHAVLQRKRRRLLQAICASAEGMSDSPRALTTAHAVAACLVQQAGRPLGYTCADVPALAAELSCYKRPRERYMDMPKPSQKLKKLQHGGAMAPGWQLDGWERPIGAMRAGGHAPHEPVSPLPMEDYRAAQADVTLTPQTAALPRPLDGCISPFQLSPRASSSECDSPCGERDNREDADCMTMNEQEYLDFVSTIFVQ